MTAIYKNTQLEETYRLPEVDDLEHAWRLSGVVCNINKWNGDTFSDDVKVSVE